MSEEDLDVEETISNQLQECIEILLECQDKNCLFCRKKKSCRKFIRMGLAAVMMIINGNANIPVDRSIMEHMFA